MKLNRIFISSFGGLKNYTLDFSDGFNVFLGNNEEGKTTVMSFIRMMFYGNDKGGSKISNNIRKKYTPWDGSQMAGSIDFELNGKNFRLEREFKSSNSSDRVTLTNTDLGTRETVPGDIGVKLFGLSAAAFERSIFIGQFNFPDPDINAEGEINARLSNIVSTGDENLSFDAVNERITKPRFELMSKSGRSGKYDKGIEKANELKERYEKAAQTHSKYLEQRFILSGHKASTDKLAVEVEKLKAKLDGEQDIKNARKFKELLETKAELEKLKNESSLPDGTIPDDGFIRKLRFCISKRDGAKQKVVSKQNEINSIEKDIDDLINASAVAEGLSEDDEKAELLNIEEKIKTETARLKKTESELVKAENLKKDSKAFKKPFSLPLLIAGAGLSVLGIILFFVKPILISAGAVGVVLAVLSFIIKPEDTARISKLDGEISDLKSEKEQINQEISLCENKASEKRAALKAIELAAKSNASLIEKRREAAEQCKKELDALKDELNVQEDLLKKETQLLGIAIFDDPEKVFESLSAIADKQKELKQKINYLLGDLGGISYEEAKEKLKMLSDSEPDEVVDFDELKKKYTALSEELTDRKIKESSAEAELKSRITVSEHPDILLRELKELVGTLAEQKIFCDASDIASEVLLESFSELRRNYSKNLEAKASDIFGMLTSNRYKSMDISKSFNISVEQNDLFGSRESEYLSSGTVDQAYLSLRLAVAELISGDEPLPVFLDDSLAQYDDERCQNATDFLSEYSKNHQIIMFTCHNSVYEAGEKSKAFVKTVSRSSELS